MRTSSLDDDALTRLRRTRIGFVFQLLQLLPTLSAVENVELPLQLAGVRNARARALRMMDLTGIADLADRQPRQLSGGQMQCVAIARALVHDPGLLLADEPTGRLDTQTAETVMGLLIDIRRQLGTSILMATHSPAAAAAADRRLVLSNGDAGPRRIPVPGIVGILAGTRLEMTLCGTSSQRRSPWREPSRCSA